MAKERMTLYSDNVEDALDVLIANELIVVNDKEELIGAYPFIMEDRENKVIVNSHVVNTMCALDALAVSPMYGINTVIRSKCRSTGFALEIKQL